MLDSSLGELLSHLLSNEKEVRPTDQVEIKKLVGNAMDISECETQRELKFV